MIFENDNRTGFPGIDLVDSDVYPKIEPNFK